MFAFGYEYTILFTGFLWQQYSISQVGQLLIFIILRNNFMVYGYNLFSLCFAGIFFMV
jgi:hypothetical protein